MLSCSRGKVSGRDIDFVKYKLLGKQKNFSSHTNACSVTFHFIFITRRGLSCKYGRKPDTKIRIMKPRISGQDTD